VNRVKSSAWTNEGKSNFNQLLYRRGTPYLYAFDLLWLNGRDLRRKPLLKRKGLLRQLVPPHGSGLLYVDHVPENGTGLFEAACQRDLEGIVAKRSSSPYSDAEPNWLKIRNRAYSQIQGRDELFKRRSAAAGAPRHNHDAASPLFYSNSEAPDLASDAFPEGGRPCTPIEAQLTP
jgi:ATP dependent DNA ligase domain